MPLVQSQVSSQIKVHTHTIQTIAWIFHVLFVSLTSLHSVFFLFERQVRDLSKTMVSIQPADTSNWSAARAELIVEAKRPLKVGELHGILKFIAFTACLCLHSSHQCHLSFFFYPRQAQLAAELSACSTDEESAEVRARFEAAERDLEHSIDHKPLEANLEVQADFQIQRTPLSLLCIS